MSAPPPLLNRCSHNHLCTSMKWIKYYPFLKVILIPECGRGKKKGTEVRNHDSVSQQNTLNFFLSYTFSSHFLRFHLKFLSEFIIFTKESKWRQKDPLISLTKRFWSTENFSICIVSIFQLPRHFAVSPHPLCNDFKLIQCFRCWYITLFSFSASAALENCTWVGKPVYLQLH